MSLPVPAVLRCPRCRMIALLASTVVAPAHAAPPAAPSEFSASVTHPVSGTMWVRWTWQDNSNDEEGFDIEYSLTSGSGFNYLTSAASNATALVQSLSVGLSPGTPLYFRGRAYKGEELSDPSNEFLYVIPSATFNAPGPVVAAAVSGDAVSLRWQDNSTTEEVFYLEYREAGGTYSGLGWVWFYTTNVTISGFDPGTDYEFRVRAAKGDPEQYTAYSGAAAVTTKDAFLGRDYEPIQLGVAFSYQVRTTAGAPRTSLTVGTLPDGLSFDPGTGIIGGTPTVSGIFQVPMQAEFEGGWTANRTMTLRIVRPAAPPVAGASITDQSLALGGGATVPLADKFSDPDTETAVRMSTSVGDIDILLFPSVTPQTVTNFLGYVDRGDYEGVSIHRSLPGFVVQGGGYKATGAPDSFTHIPTVASPPNEPGVSNLRGTVAMAKREGDPNSATSEFFFSLADNNDPDEPLSLDNQNGGFTAFGRVAAPGMSLVDAIAALPRGTYAIDLDGSVVSFPDWPMDADSAPPTMDQSKLVLIHSVAPVSPLSYAVTSNSNPSVASAVVDAGQIELSGLGPGQATITVTATDLDGDTVSQNFDVTVTETFEQWAARSGIPGGLSAPGDDGDRDGSCNLGEFAFLTNPMRADAAAGRPTISVAGSGGHGASKISFRLRKFTNGLSYRVEASANLISWEPVWESGQGLSLPHVQAEDHGDYHLVTVEDPDQPANAARYFLRVVASSAVP